MIYTDEETERHREQKCETREERTQLFLSLCLCLFFVFLYISAFSTIASFINSFNKMIVKKNGIEIFRDRFFDYFLKHSNKKTYFNDNNNNKTN